MSEKTTATASGTLRLVWPQWQGAGSSVVSELASEFPLSVARRGYAVGSAVLDAVLPPHDGPTANVPVAMGEAGLGVRDGIEAKDVVLAQLDAALDIIEERNPERILTLGGECSVSVAPFSALASRYPDDLAIVWIDSHPDVDTNESDYLGYHAMAVTALVGRGDHEVQRLLPATIPAERIALVGLHAWTDDVIGNVTDWGLASFAPEQLRSDSRVLLDWLAGTGCSRVAIHFDVDTIDSREVVLGLGAEPGGLTSEQTRRIVADVSAATDVVGLTIAEFIPRQVMRLQEIVEGFPLI